MINLIEKDEYIKAYEGIVKLTKVKANKKRLNDFLDYWQKFIIMRISYGKEDKAKKQWKAGLPIVEFMQNEINNAPSKLLTLTKADKSGDKKTTEEIEEESQMALASFTAEPREED